MLISDWSSDVCSSVLFCTTCGGKEARYGVAQLRSIRTDVSISLKRHSIDMSVVIGASMRNFGSRLFPRFAVNGDAFCAFSHLLPCRRCTKIAITNIPERRRLGFSKAALGLESAMFGVVHNRLSPSKDSSRRRRRTDNAWSTDC